MLALRAALEHPHPGWPADSDNLSANAIRALAIAGWLIVLLVLLLGISQNIGRCDTSTFGWHRLITMARLITARAFRKHGARERGTAREVSRLQGHQDASCVRVAHFQRKVHATDPLAVHVKMQGKTARHCRPHNEAPISVGMSGPRAGVQKPSTTESRKSVCQIHRKSCPDHHTMLEF